MASKTTRTGILQTETTVKHPGTGYTQCPNEDCERIIGSASLTCKYCGKTRVPASKKDHYVNRAKVVSMTTHASTIAEINSRIEQSLKIISAQDEEIKTLKAQLANERTLKMIEREGRLEEKAGRIAVQTKLDRAAKALSS